MKSRCVKAPAEFEKSYYYTAVVSPCIQAKGTFEEKEMRLFGKDDLKVAVLKSDYGYYIQPREPHYKYQFEDFFQFGPGNLGYSKERTVYVPFKEPEDFDTTYVITTDFKKLKKEVTC